MRRATVMEGTVRRFRVNTRAHSRCAPRNGQIVRRARAFMGKLRGCSLLSVGRLHPDPARSRRRGRDGGGEGASGEVRPSSSDGIGRSRCTPRAIGSARNCRRDALICGGEKRTLRSPKRRPRGDVRRPRNLVYSLGESRRMCRSCSDDRVPDRWPWSQSFRPGSVAALAILIFSRSKLARHFGTRFRDTSGVYCSDGTRHRDLVVKKCKLINSH